LKAEKATDTFGLQTWSLIWMAQRIGARRK
jgi:hypothetical protein